MIHKKLFITLIVLMQFSVLSEAQNLFLDTWYVQSITANGSTYAAPETIDMPFVKLQTVSDDMLLTEMCAGGFSCEVAYEGDDSFALSNFHAFDNSCSQANTQAFYQRVIDFFQQNIAGSFIYDITAYASVPSETVVVITAVDGSVLRATNFPYGMPPEVWKQNPILKKIVWRGAEWLAPDNDEAANIHLSFAENSPAFETHTCNMASLTGFADFNLEGTELTFREIAMNAADCNNDDNNAFTGAYFTLLETRQNYPFSITTNTATDNFVQLILQDADNNQLVFESNMTGIAESQLQPMVQLYPNPAKDVIYCSFAADGAMPTCLSIYSLQGQLLQTIPLSAHEKMGQYAVDVSALAAGTYALVWQYDTAVVLKKVAISK